MANGGVFASVWQHVSYKNGQLVKDRYWLVFTVNIKVDLPSMEAG